jgi:hypothetical protein
MNEHFYNGFIKRAQDYGLTVVESDSLAKTAGIWDKIRGTYDRMVHGPAPARLGLSNQDMAEQVSPRLGLGDLASNVPSVAKQLNDLHGYTPPARLDLEGHLNQTIGVPMRSESISEQLQRSPFVDYSKPENIEKHRAYRADKMNYLANGANSSATFPMKRRFSPDYSLRLPAVPERSPLTGR